MLKFFDLNPLVLAAGLQKFSKKLALLITEPAIEFHEKNKRGDPWTPPPIWGEAAIGRENCWGSAKFFGSNVKNGPQKW